MLSANGLFDLRQKKSRKANWTDEEVRSLLLAYDKHRNVMRNQQGLYTKAHKQAIWEEITEAVNSSPSQMTSSFREVKEVIKKWVNMINRMRLKMQSVKMSGGELSMKSKAVYIIINTDEPLDLDRLRFPGSNGYEALVKLEKSDEESYDMSADYLNDLQHIYPSHTSANDSGDQHIYPSHTSPNDSGDQHIYPSHTSPNDTGDQHIYPSHTSPNDTGDQHIYPSHTSPNDTGDQLHDFTADDSNDGDSNSKGYSNDEISIEGSVEVDDQPNPHSSDSMQYRTPESTETSGKMHLSKNFPFKRRKLNLQPTSPNKTENNRDLGTLYRGTSVEIKEKLLHFRNKKLQLELERMVLENEKLKLEKERMITENETALILKEKAQLELDILKKQHHEVSTNV